MGPGARGCPPERWPADISASAHLFVGSAAELTDTVEVGGEDGHHLARVLRLRTGETVTVGDGSGRWRPYRIGSVGGSASTGAAVRLEAAGAVEREPALSPRLAVAFALTKGDKPELVVQKLTEFGVDRIVPVLAERSVSRPDPARADAAAERWRRIVREAARQCRRATLPAVEELAPLATLAGHPGVVVAERGGGPADALASPPAGEILVVVGPEGGLAPAEVEALKPWGRLGLGPHVLRAETATLAAATVLSALRRPAS
ncbi:MAG TPA: RsmE family RNA methyltransferase [Acidimicrobiia bacterium]|nr:RsmE family RNA methyltransferase [Acidimicrobiia bacterium]